MENYIDSYMQLVSYDYIYLNRLQPKLVALDMFLKENNAPFHVYEVANILEIEISELTTFLQERDFKELDTIALFSFIFHSSSEVCGYIARQWKYHQATEYTPEIVADIYKLNLHKVKIAFNDLGVTLITNDQLIDIFKRIHVTLFKAS